MVDTTSSMQAFGFLKLDTTIEYVTYWTNIVKFSCPIQTRYSLGSVHGSLGPSHNAYFWSPWDRFHIQEHPLEGKHWSSNHRLVGIAENTSHNQTSHSLCITEGFAQVVYLHYQTHNRDDCSEALLKVKCQSLVWSYCLLIIKLDSCLGKCWRFNDLPTESLLTEPG